MRISQPGEHRLTVQIDHVGRLGDEALRFPGRPDEKDPLALDRNRLRTRLPLLAGVNVPVGEDGVGGFRRRDRSAGEAA